MKYKDILDFAKKKGYDNIQFLKKWNGYECYEPLFDNVEILFIGLPLVIMVKGNEIRMSTIEECMLI